MGAIYCFQSTSKQEKEIELVSLYNTEEKEASRITRVAQYSFNRICWEKVGVLVEKNEKTLEQDICAISRKILSYYTNSSNKTEGVVRALIPWIKKPDRSPFKYPNLLSIMLTEAAQILTDDFDPKIRRRFQHMKCSEEQPRPVIDHIIALLEIPGLHHAFLINILAELASESFSVRHVTLERLYDVIASHDDPRVRSMVYPLLLDSQYFNHLNRCCR